MGARTRLAGVGDPAYRGCMSTIEPDDAAEALGQDTTPYIAPDESPEDPADGVTDLDDLKPALSPAEEVQLRRDLELEMERFEQGMQG